MMQSRPTHPCRSRSLCLSLRKTQSTFLIISKAFDLSSLNDLDFSYISGFTCMYMHILTFWFSNCMYSKCIIVHVFVSALLTAYMDIYLYILFCMYCTYSVLFVFVHITHARYLHHKYLCMYIQKQNTYEYVQVGTYFLLYIFVCIICTRYVHHCSYSMYHPDASMCIYKHKICDMHMYCFGIPYLYIYVCIIQVASRLWF